MPQKLLDQFTAETGVKVNYVRHRLGRDPQQAAGRQRGEELHRRRRRVRLVVHRPVRRRAVGGAAGGPGRPEDAGRPEVRPTKAFISGGKTYAACYSNDFRVSMYNKAMFDEGRDRPSSRRPSTSWPATSPSSRHPGVQYPLSIPMAATEGGVTPWYLLTLAMGGQLFDDQQQPDVLRPRARPATRRCSGRSTRSRTAGSRPARSRWTTPSPSNKFTAGENGDRARDRPRQHADRERPEPVEHRRRRRRSALVPGVDGPGGSFGLPEGLSIPVTAKHKAAAAAFIEWWERPENAIAIYKTQGSLPCGAAALKQLADSGQLQGGDVARTRSCRTSGRCSRAARRSGTRSSAPTPRAC